MRCTVKNFKEKYNVPGDVDFPTVSSITGEENGVRVNLYNYIDQANSDAKRNGFNKKLFEVRNNPKGEPYVKINSLNISTYNDMLEREDYHELRRQQEPYNDLHKEKRNKYDTPEEAMDSESFEQGRLLFNPNAQGNSEGEGATFADWINDRVEMTDRLKELAAKYRNENEKEKLKEVNVLIEKLQEEINNIDPSDPEQIYRESIEEIEALDEFLTDLSSDPVEMSRLMEANQIIERIQALSSYFLAQDPVTGKQYQYTEMSDDKRPIAKFYFNFKQSLDGDKFEKLQNRQERLNKKLERVKGRIVQGIISNDAYIQQNVEEGNMSTEDIDKILEMIRNGEIDTTKLSSMFLGGGGNGIIPQVLKNMRENQYIKERGKIQRKMEELKKAWANLKDKKENGEEVFKLLLEKDKLGVPRRRLISRYTGRFWGKLKEVASDRRMFYNNMSETNYSNWMETDKNTFHRIDPRLLSVANEKYGDKEEFEHSKEEIKEYESKLKKQLGEHTFKVESQKALELLDNYYTDVENDIMTQEQQYRKNPFKFLDNYNSENYNKKDPNSFEYLEPEYTNSVPKFEKENYNEEFEKVENSKYGKELMEFYGPALELSRDYINPSFRSEGHYKHPLEIAAFEDLSNKSMIKNMGFFGRNWTKLTNSFRQYRQRFYNRELQRIKEQINDPEFEKELQSGGSGYASMNITQLKKFYEKLSLPRLKEIAVEEGIDISPLEGMYKNALQDRTKEELAHSLATYMMNKSISPNLFDDIDRSIDLTTDINARKTTLPILKTMQEFANNIEDKQGNKPTNLINFLKRWGDTNIYGYSLAGDYNNGKGFNWFSKMLKKNTPDIPGVSPARLKNNTEKQIEKTIDEELGEKGSFQKMKDFFEEEGKNGNSMEDGTFEFSLGNVEYENRNGKFYKKINSGEKEIGLKEIKAQYKKYLLKNFEEMGIRKSYGSVILGMQRNIVQKNLSVNIWSGIRNAVHGTIQNRHVAAGGKYGFTKENLNSAYRFLHMSNTRKYFFKNQYKNTKKGQNMETAKQLMHKMGILQNAADETALDSEIGSKTNNAMGKLGNFMMDFSINNPEWKNQTSLVLSILQNVYVKDKEGNDHPVFNKDTHEFIYKPGTLELKDKFKSRENTEMWEEFQEYKGDKKSVVTIGRAKQVIEKTQGNYNPHDVVNVQDNVAGKTLTMYMRYFFENTNLHWGNHRIDTRTGEMNVKGRKLNLMEHAPTAGLYYLMTKPLGIVGAASTVAATFTIMSPAVAAGVLGTSIALGGLATYKIMRNIGKGKINTRKIYSRQELLLSMDFLKEALLKSIASPVERVTNNDRTAISKAERDFTKKSWANYEKRGMTRGERRLISEAAEEVATKFGNYVFWTGLGVIANIGFAALLGPDDDEENTEEGFKAFVKDLEMQDGVLNTLINTRNDLNNDINTYIDPTSYLDDAQSFAFLRSLQKFRKFIAEDTPKAISEQRSPDFSYSEYSFEFIKNNPFIPAPTHLIEPVLSDKNSLFNDRFVYEGKSYMDKKLVFGPSMTETQRIKKKFRENRAELRIRLSNYYQEYLINNLEKINKARVKRGLSKITDYNSKSFKSLRKDMVKDYLRKNDLYKQRKESYKNMDKRVNWEKVYKSIEDATLKEEKKGE